MSAPLLYVTGTNTGVGKTTLACLLLRRARERDIQLAAIKPFCSGGREDAEELQAVQSARLSIDEVNPFHFTEPIAPYVAARNENRAITLPQTIAAIKRIQSRNIPTLIEGAGGLLSPLGEKFTLLDIIQELPGKICIVAPNSLGVINCALLTHRALEKVSSTRLHFVLMNFFQRDASANSNASVIRDWTNVETVEFPFLPEIERETPNSFTGMIDGLLDWWIGDGEAA
jgi:dethiobiotin synthetase